MATQQDPHQAAKEAYDDCKEAWSENHGRMLKDLRFSNPADPQQWDAAAAKLRKGRIMHTHDRTNQYKQQVVNSARKNKPGILTSPADSRGDVEVAKRIDGVIRHIEYASRAHIAYDTAIGHAADCGIGWIRVTPRVVKQTSNHQEWRIERVVDPLSIVCDGNEPDGSDMTAAFIETMVPTKQFKKDYPKCSESNWGDASSGWVLDKMVRVCERMYVVESDEKWVTVRNPESGEELDLSEADYKELVAQIGFQPPIVAEFKATKRKVMWQKLGAYEMLEEETEFPSPWIGVVPVIGYETFLDGKRYLCGLTRRLMPSQIAYNFERSAGTEAVALQPKAPLMAPGETIEGYPDHYAAYNNGTASILPYNAWDGEGRALPAPQRLSPPTLPTAYLQGAEFALRDMEAAIGVLRTSGDAPPASASGRALRERANSADTATFHFPDNQSVSIEHVGRIIVGGIPRLYDTKRVARIIGEEGGHDSVVVDPEMPEAVARKNGKVVAVNFGVGEYDVRIKTGPSYTSQRESAAEGIEQILSSAPQFTAVLGPQLVKLRDFPDSDKTAKMMVATLPPELQKIWNEGNDSDPEKQAQELQAAQQQLQQMQQQIQMMQQAGLAQQQQLQQAMQENQQIKADAGVKQADVQIKMLELELKSREIAIREQEAEVKAMEAETRAVHAGEKAAAEVELQARRAEVDAYKADTERMRMEQDGLIAERHDQLQAAQAIVTSQGELGPLQRMEALEDAILALQSQIAGMTMQGHMQQTAEELMDTVLEDVSQPAAMLQITDEGE